MTSQVMFDGHVLTLLHAAVSLVNALTDGERQGRPYTAPHGDQLPRAAHEALPLADARDAAVEPEHAAYLAGTARQFRVVFDALDNGPTDGAAEAVNVLLRTTGARPQLDRGDGDPWQVHFHGATDTAVGWSAGCATALALPSAATSPDASASAPHRTATASTSTTPATPPATSARMPAATASRPQLSAHAAAHEAEVRHHPAWAHHSASRAAATPAVRVSELNTAPLRPSPASRAAGARSISLGVAREAIRAGMGRRFPVLNLAIWTNVSDSRPRSLRW